MKRVWKIMLYSMAILLLILTAATFAIWTWSRWHDDYVWIHLSERSTLVHCHIYKLG